MSWSSRFWICPSIAVYFFPHNRCVRLLPKTDVLGLYSQWCGKVLAQSVLCSVNVCDHPSFSPLSTLTIYTVFSPPDSLITWCPPNHSLHTTGIPHPAIVSSNVKQESSHRWHRLPQQLVSSLNTFQFSINPMPSQAGMHTLTSDPSHSQETSGCKKRGGKKKQPHIKKPLNAFMLYMKEMRAKVVASAHWKRAAAINQILGRRVSVSNAPCKVVADCLNY